MPSGTQGWAGGPRVVQRELSSAWASSRRRPRSLLNAHFFALCFFSYEWRNMRKKARSDRRGAFLSFSPFFFFFPFSRPWLPCLHGAAPSLASPLRPRDVHVRFERSFDPAGTQSSLSTCSGGTSSSSLTPRVVGPRTSCCSTRHARRAFPCCTPRTRAFAWATAKGAPAEMFSFWADRAVPPWPFSRAFSFIPPLARPSPPGWHLL